MEQDETLCKTLEHMRSANVHVALMNPTHASMIAVETIGAMP